MRSADNALRPARIVRRRLAVPKAARGRARRVGRIALAGSSVRKRPHGTGRRKRTAIHNCLVPRDRRSFGLARAGDRLGRGPVLALADQSTKRSTKCFRDLAPKDHSIARRANTVLQPVGLIWLAALASIRQQSFAQKTVSAMSTMGASQGRAAGYAMYPVSPHTRSHVGRGEGAIRLAACPSAGLARRHVTIRMALPLRRTASPWRT